MMTFKEYLARVDGKTIEGIGWMTYEASIDALRAEIDKLRGELGLAKKNDAQWKIEAVKAIDAALDKTKDVSKKP